MIQIMNKVKTLLPIAQSWEPDFFDQIFFPVADKQVIDFISHLSQAILKDPKFRNYPELMAMGFWMRKAHIKKILDDNLNKHQLQLARGVVFHIAPSNVDSIFIYSWFLSMLAGNINVIRLSSKSNEQIALLLDLLNNLLQQPEYTDIAKRQKIVSYGHDDDITAYFSENCDMRIIWGGDNTINKIRQIPIPPTAIELPFTDKFSLSLLNANQLLSCEKKEYKHLIQQFINDAYWFGQMACSSPRLIVWQGDENTINKAKDYFWDGVTVFLTQDDTDISTADIMNKLVATQSLAIETKVTIVNSNNNLINRVELDSIGSIETELHCGAGLFYEYSINQLDDLLQLLSRKIQTIGYFGFTDIELQQFIRNTLPKGADRFVPIGSALDFSPNWDGYNFLSEFTRIVEIT